MSLIVDNHSLSGTQYRMPVFRIAPIVRGGVTLNTCRLRSLRFPTCLNNVTYSNNMFRFITTDGTMQLYEIFIPPSMYSNVQSVIDYVNGRTASLGITIKSPTSSTASTGVQLNFNKPVIPVGMMETFVPYDTDHSIRHVDCEQVINYQTFYHSREDLWSILGFDTYTLINVNKTLTGIYNFGDPIVDGDKTGTAYVYTLNSASAIDLNRKVHAIHELTSRMNWRAQNRARLYIADLISVRIQTSSNIETTINSSTEQGLQYSEISRIDLITKQTPNPIFNDIYMMVDINQLITIPTDGTVYMYLDGVMTRHAFAEGLDALLTLEYTM